MFATGFLILGCRPEVREQPDFLELRLHRWTALEGGETMLLRRIGSGWSATFLGDGQRFSCLYQRSVRPISDWNKVWTDLVAAGLLEIPKGQLGSLKVQDGDGFDGEVSFEGTITRFEIPHPKEQDFPAAQRVLQISDLIAYEFGSPVFRKEYDRGKVGEYLIENCKGIHREYSR